MTYMMRAKRDFKRVLFDKSPKQDSHTDAVCAPRKRKLDMPNVVQKPSRANKFPHSRIQRISNHLKIERLHVSKSQSKDVPSKNFGAYRQIAPKTSRMRTAHRRVRLRRTQSKDVHWNVSQNQKHPKLKQKRADRVCQNGRDREDSQLIHAFFGRERNGIRDDQALNRRGLEAVHSIARKHGMRA